MSETPLSSARRERPQREKPDIPGSGRMLILDTAARLFRQRGYAATSLRDIATACGMKAGSLYYHFESKDAIVSDVLRIGVTHVHDEVQRAVDALGDTGDARLLIDTAVTAHLRALFHSENYTSANIRIFSQVPIAVQQSHLPLRRHYEQFWADLLARCARNGRLDTGHNLRYAQLLLLGTLNSTLEWFRPERGPIAPVAAELTRLFLDGITAR